MNKINQLIETKENGNITEFKKGLEKLNKIELLNLIQEYHLLKGGNFGDIIQEIKRWL